MQFRQGDLLITKIDSLPKNLKKVIDGVILRGESTGHKHQLIGGDVFTDKSGLLYLALSKNGEVVHEEHGAIKLPKGLYAVKRQREYTNQDATKLVVD